MNLRNRHTAFLKTFVSDFKVGAIARSSKYVIKSVTENIPSETRTLVEYGAGDGVVTKAVLALLPSNARLVAVELNREFANALRRIDDPRICVVHGTVQDVAARPDLYGIADVDAVLSSIPFLFIPPRERTRIVANTHRMLKPGGAFIVFHQYTPMVVPLLKKYFAQVDTSFEPRNVLPCFLMRAQKSSENHYEV